jgi:hypothetical protein
LVQGGLDEEISNLVEQRRRRTKGSKLSDKCKFVKNLSNKEVINSEILEILSKEVLLYKGSSRGFVC